MPARFPVAPIPAPSFPRIDPPAKMLYFDSTYLFRIYSVEPCHTAVKKLLVQANQPVAIAWQSRAEIASILLRKRREGADTPEHLASLANQFHVDSQGQLIRFLPLAEAVMVRLESVLAAAPLFGLMGVNVMSKT